jgi:hypothetical protein
MSSHLGFFLSFSLGLSGALSGPFQDPPDCDKRHFLMTLNHRSYRQSLPFDDAIFDPTYVVSLIHESY